MFKENEYVSYKKEICRIKEIKEVNSKKFYVLNPIDDDSLTIKVPLLNEQFAMKKLISKKEIEKIINEIPNVNIISVENDKMIEQVYKDLFNNGNHEDLIKIIKTTYFRNQNRLKNRKKIGEKDEAYFKKSERLLYDEFSIVLGLSYDETKKIIIDKLNNTENGELNEVK